MMYASRLTTRWLATLCVLVGVALASAWPMIPLADAGISAGFGGTALESCCCGSVDAQCCGMACCLPQAPENPAERTDGKGAQAQRPSLLLAASRLESAECSPAPGKWDCYQHAGEAGYWLAISSLQRLQVRLDA